jgi:D-beta-D-heptose 7-phosphate kinase/D-beta-D-heptose 1-phosphate adenosyltransferase
MGKVIFTNGCFDILHTGHISLLKECRELAGADGKVIVGLNSDRSVRRLKGENRPVNAQKDRKEMLESLRYVDEVIIFDEETPEMLLSILTPDVLVKGGDYALTDIIGKQYVKDVIIFPYVNGYSTTSTIKKIQCVGAG